MQANGLMVIGKHSAISSAFQAALRCVEDAHGREVLQLQAKMAELRELVTQLQWRRTVNEEMVYKVRATNVEAVAPDGSPLVVETVMADGRRFKTLEPPELVPPPQEIGRPWRPESKPGPRTGNSSDEGTADSANGGNRGEPEESPDTLEEREAQNITRRPELDDRLNDKAASTTPTREPKQPEYLEALSPLDLEALQSSGGSGLAYTPVPPESPSKNERRSSIGRMSCCNSTGGKSTTPSDQRSFVDLHIAPSVGEVKRPAVPDSSAERTSLRIANELHECQIPAERRQRHRLSNRSESRSRSVPFQRQYSRFWENPWNVDKLVKHWSFDCACGTMITINTVLIGLSTQYIAHNAGVESLEYAVAGMICSCFFLVELLLRIYVQRMHFFVSEGWRWNVFDMMLVLFSIIDAIIEYGFKGDAGSVGQSMKTVKMLRIVRVFRVFRFFTELRLLALMIVDSFKSLAWALLMLGIIMYVFAIWFTHDATDHIQSLRTSGEQVDPVLMEHFGDLFATLSSLFHAMLNGISWYVLTQALQYSAMMTGLFFFYVSFTLLAVLNIITGVFVDNAVETARTQREFMVEKQIEQKQKWLIEMKDLFQEMDSDGSGSINLKEIQEYLCDPRVESYFQALGLEPHDTERLFGHLDDDGSGEVSLDEFLQGCLRLKGQARSIDVYSVMHETAKIGARLDELEEMLRCSSPAPNRSEPRGQMPSQSATFESISPPPAVRKASMHASTPMGVPASSAQALAALGTLPDVSDEEGPRVVQRSSKPIIWTDGRDTNGVHSHKQRLLVEETSTN